MSVYYLSRPVSDRYRAERMRRVQEEVPVPLHPTVRLLITVF